MNGQKTLGSSAIRWSAVGLAAYALIGGAVTLVGWFAVLPRLTDWAGSGISMFPITAFAAVCSGAALILANLNQRSSIRLSGILGFVVLLLGTATLFEHFSGIDLGIDTILIQPSWGQKAAVAPGRMGLPASISYTLLGLALVLMASGRSRARRIAPALGIIVATIALLSLIGYVFGADPLFAVAKLTGIAMQTASVLLALSLGVIASVPEYDPMRMLQANTAAGLLARRSLPFIIGLPFILGWMRVRGQAAGWFDTAMGTALLVLALVVTFCGLLWWWIGTVAGHERKLAEARDLLATTVASIGDAVIATDSDGDVLFLNSEAERLTGWKNSEANGQPLPKVFHIINEDTRQAAENPVEKVFHTGKVAGLANHTLLVSKDGTETPIDDSAAPIRVPDGPLFGVVLVFRDVTEQRKAHQSASRLAAVVEHSGDAIFTKNLDGMIQTWNPSAERLFGYRAEEIVGKSVTVLLPPDRMNEENRIIEGLRQGHAVERLETVRVAKDGKRIPVAVSVSPLRNGDGEIIGASKIIHDISEVVAAREALMREKELLATTLASIGDAVIVTDAEGRITFLNAEAERLTKWSSAEAASQPLPTVFRIINEETRAAVENPVEKVLRLGGVVGLANHTVLIAKDGTETPIDDSAAPIRQPGGPLFGVVLVFRDFTERKQTEQQLRELSLFPAQNPAPILRVTGDGTLLYANPAAAKELRQWQLEIGRPVVDEVKSFATEALHTRQATLRESKLGARDYLIFIVPIVEAGYVNLYWTDVTERKQAEEKVRQAAEAVRQSQERLQAIISSAMDAVITIDSRQRIVLFNPAAETMFGLTATEAMGKQIERLIPDRFRSSHGKFVEAFERTGVSNRKMGALGSISGLRANGEEFPAEASISQIEIGGEKLFTVIMRDITERKKAEERQGRLAAIIENSEDAIMSKTLDSVVTSWNPGAEALFGYKASEMIGRSMRELFPPECAPEEDMILTRLRAGESTHRETVRLRKDGRRVPVSITCSPIRDVSGKVIGGSKIARDISLQKETEEKLRDAQRKLLMHAADLEATVAERTAKLQETVQELQSFSYSIAHDMRAPLRAMGTFAQLLLNEVPAATASPEAKTYCERIVIGAGRLDNLIKDALNYTKAVLQEFPLQPVDLSKLVRGLVDTYPNLHAENANIEVEQYLPVVLGNESLLTQCFSNLLGNAVKFVAPGVRPKVRVTSKIKDGIARIWVEDNGIGIPKQAQPRLFGMFQKLDSQYEGTGIGLAIVRKVVERMGGKVGVESEPDRGSRFWVELRVAPKKDNV